MNDAGNKDATAVVVARSNEPVSRAVHIMRSLSREHLDDMVRCAGGAGLAPAADGAILSSNVAGTRLHGRRVGLAGAAAHLAVPQYACRAGAGGDALPIMERHRGGDAWALLGVAHLARLVSLPRAHEGAQADDALTVPRGFAE